MVEDELNISLIAPTRDAEEAITASRRRISWSATQLMASHDTAARAHEALKQSYIRLEKLRPTPSDPSRDD